MSPTIIESDSQCLCCQPVDPSFINEECACTFTVCKECNAKIKDLLKMFIGEQSTLKQALLAMIQYKSVQEFQGII